MLAQDRKLCCLSEKKLEIQTQSTSSEVTVNSILTYIE